MPRPRVPRRLLPTALLFATLSVLPSAQGQWIGWPPRTTRTVEPSPTVPVRLRLQSVASGHQAWVDNDLHGPVEIRIEGPSGYVHRQVLDGPGTHRIDGLRGTTLRLRLVAVPGAPDARPTPYRYRLPLQMPSLRIGQGPAGRFSHGDAENLHAIDFAAPLGTPVLAAREGIVMQVTDGFADAPGALDEANAIRILHEDGSMALYAHLRQGSAVVAPGQHVRSGQTIAQSGNSGWSSGPHLHFVVQVNRGLRLESLPVEVETPEGALRLPRH